MSDASSIPGHVGVIVDGNRRWAKSRGIPVLEGHRKGYQLLKDAADWLFERGVKELSAFIFSTENWNRSAQEVSDLMDLTRWVLKNEVEQMHKKNIRVRVSGLRSHVAEDILKLIDDVVEKTKHNTKGVLNLCFNYGARADIVNAAKKLIDGGTSATDINEGTFARELSTSGMADVDMVIRTSEQRLSNFLLWESAYAELYFLPEKLWPDMREQDFSEALAWYGGRKRRFGN